MREGSILFTGGSGLLGEEFKKIVPDILYPDSKIFNIEDIQKMRRYILNKNIHCIIHAAALTSPPVVDTYPMRALKTNIIGTANIVEVCNENQIYLIYISTDYVFRGDKGNYKEEDDMYPVNRYAWSKLGGECAVRMYDRSLIIRTSFGKIPFPYEKAFIDQWTSREGVDVIARKIAFFIKELRDELYGVIHVGGKRKIVFEYAMECASNREIGKISISDVQFVAPQDTSLCCDRYEEIISQIKEI